MDNRISVEVLGPLRVRLAGGRVELPAVLRRLLALLLCGAGSPVAAEALAERLWQGRPRFHRHLHHQPVLRLAERAVRHAVGEHLCPVRSGVRPTTFQLVKGVLRREREGGVSPPSHSEKD